MGPEITAIAYTTLAILAGAFIAFTIFDKTKKPLAIRIAVLWLGATAIAFIMPYKLLALILIAGLLVAVGPGSAPERVCLYIASLAMLPDYYNVDVPFPGLNYLINLDYAKLATLILLGPVFVSSMFSKPPAHLRSVDRYLLFFVLLTGVMSVRDLPFTSMMRTTVDNFLLIFVPYIAISRGLKTLDDLDLALKSAFISVIMLAVIGVVSTAFSWNYYAQLTETITHKFYTDYRNGFLRIQATLNSTLLGLLMGLGAACVVYVRAERLIPTLYAIGLLGLFAAVTFVTGARGGWMSALVVFGLCAFFIKAGKGMRNAALVAIAAGVAAVFVLVFRESDIVSDQYGTFAYRAELLRTSIEQISVRPLFGQVDFSESPRFAHLIQGEGIVDIVNGYLQVVLTYGLISFGLFLGAHLTTLSRALKVIGMFDKKRDTDEEKRLRRAAVLLVAAHIGFLAMIMTVSAVSLVWHYCYLLIGLSVAAVRVAAVFEETPAPQAAPVEAPGPEGSGSDAPGSDAKGRVAGPATSGAAPVTRARPYGARFVR